MHVTDATLSNEFQTAIVCNVVDLDLKFSWPSYISDIYSTCFALIHIEKRIEKKNLKLEIT